MGASKTIVVKSLREQVYGYLRNQLKLGTLTPSVFLDLNAMAASMGISRTPLRDALLQLEAEDFITFIPRKGVMVNPLEPKDIQEIYQLVGALESSALLAAAPLMDDTDYQVLEASNARAREALEAGDMHLYYDQNLAFHNHFLERCGNSRILKTVQLQKQRLYEWTQDRSFQIPWEMRNVEEHDALVKLLRKGKAREAAEFLRDVHWGYEAQKSFVEEFYFKKH